MPALVEKGMRPHMVRLTLGGLDVENLPAGDSIELGEVKPHQGYKQTPPSMPPPSSGVNNRVAHFSQIHGSIFTYVIEGFGE